MTDTITLRRDGIEATPTVRVGDVVPMMDGGRARIEALIPGNGPLRLIWDAMGVRRSYKMDGTIYGLYGAPSIDIAKLAEQQAAIARPTIASDADLSSEALAKFAAEMAGYYRNWLKAPGETSSSIVQKWRDDVARYEAIKAALARPAAVPADIAAVEEAAYKRGWNDREDDLIAGVERIVPPEHRQPAVPAEAIQVLAAGMVGDANLREGCAKGDIDRLFSGRLEGEAKALRRCAADLLKLLEAHNG